MSRLILIRFGLSAAGIGLFIAVAVVLVASFLSRYADIESFAWVEGLSGPLFLALVVVLVLRQLLIWLWTPSASSSGSSQDG